MTQNASAKKRFPVRQITVTAVMAAISTVLMMLSFSVPLVPSYLKLDFSELPALITSFALGPVWGIAVCLVKNLINLCFTTTGGVGELSNFLLGACFVGTAGIFYRCMHGRMGALAGSLLGAAIMAGASLLTNYYIVYPFYSNIMSMDAIMGMYQAIVPAADTLWKGLAIFNMPFTFVKGLLSVVITFLIYKRISPLLKGKKK